MVTAMKAHVVKGQNEEFTIMSVHDIGDDEVKR